MLEVSVIYQTKAGNLPGIHLAFKWNLALAVWQLPLGNQSLQISPTKYQSFVLLL